MSSESLLQTQWSMLVPRLQIRKGPISTDRNTRSAESWTVDNKRLWTLKWGSNKQLLLYILILNHRWRLIQAEWREYASVYYPPLVQIMVCRLGIFWTNAGILFIRTLAATFSEIVSEIQTFRFKKMYLKISSVKWWQFCLGINVLTHYHIWTHFDTFGVIMYTAQQKFGITLVSWSTRGNTATQMTIYSRIWHRIFSNFVW